MKSLTQVIRKQNPRQMLAIQKFDAFFTAPKTELIAVVVKSCSLFQSFFPIFCKFNFRCTVTPIKCLIHNKMPLNIQKMFLYRKWTHKT